MGEEMQTHTQRDALRKAGRRRNAIKKVKILIAKAIAALITCQRAHIYGIRDNSAEYNVTVRNRTRGRGLPILSRKGDDKLTRCHMCEVSAELRRWREKQRVVRIAAGRTGGPIGNRVRRKAQFGATEGGRKPMSYFPAR